MADKINRELDGCYFRIQRDGKWQSICFSDLTEIERDSVMKANIPGEREGMYMATDSMFVDVEDIVVKGEYAQEARGLWEMEGDMMGGPFVSHARVDRANGRVVVVEAFIYSPDKLKRNLMRQMEASLYTLRLPNESLIDEIVISGNIPEEKIDTTSRVK